MAADRVQPEPELRLVLLGRAGAGQSRAGDAILGRPARRAGGPDGDGDGAAGTAARCQQHRGRVAGRQVVVVTVPDWFSSRSAPPQEARALFSSFVALSSPGPHAFLLCVPAGRPSDGEERALAALEQILGPSAVTAHTLVLFTRGEEQQQEQQEEEEEEKKEEVQTLEQLLSTQRPDLLELVDLCGGRCHALMEGSGGGGAGGGEEEEEREEKRRSRSVQELLEKVEQVAAGEEDFFTCALYKEAGERVRERREQLARERRERSGGEEEEEVPDDDDGAQGGEPEESELDLDLDVDLAGVLASVSPASPPPSLLWGLWERLLGWLRRVPKLVRLEALFGSLVGLFVGGPTGRMLGATAGSVATEVGRRNQKQKTK